MFACTIGCCDSGILCELLNTLILFKAINTRARFRGLLLRFFWSQTQEKL